MTEHRVEMEPSILLRLAESMRHIAEAWQRDVDAVREANGQNESLMRAMNAANDRADNLNGDLIALRNENRVLIDRNSWLEAQYQLLHDTTLDARDALTTLAERAARRAEDAPTVARTVAPPRVHDDGTTAPRPAPAAAPTPDREIPPSVDRTDDHDDDDGTGLPAGKPFFLRTPLPDIDFAPQRAAQ